MPASALSAQDIIAKVASLSEKHVLKRMPAQYIADFAQAAINVYDGRKIEDILQHKFHIPDDANFTEDSYRDNRLKDALVYAHDKFPADPNTDELNVLFSCVW